MIRLIILGDNLASLSAAHHVLDLETDMDIQVITDRAEIGLVDETPGLLLSWPPFPSHWISEMGSQTPEPTSTAVRGSWLLKAMGIQLSKRGCTFHLRTRVTNVSDESVDFVGAGPLGEATLTFDYIIDFDEDTSSEPQWFGAVCRSDDAPVTPLKGYRSDGTTEVWDRNQHEQNGKWLQTMVWNGRDPESFVDDQVRIGKERAENVIETIIQRTSSQ